jgi:hypothetical protein
MSSRNECHPDFLPVLEKHLLTNGLIQRWRAKSLTLSEVMTILIYFHLHHFSIGEFFNSLVNFATNVDSSFPFLY